jgi:hypothetical protein
VKQGADIKSGKSLGDTEPEELKMIQQIYAIVTKISNAEGVDLLDFKSDTKAFLQRLLKKAEDIEKRATEAGDTEETT